jgi:hypothetical protein
MVATMGFAGHGVVGPYAVDLGWWHYILQVPLQTDPSPVMQSCAAPILMLGSRNKLSTVSCCELAVHNYRPGLSVRMCLLDFPKAANHIINTDDKG